MTGDLLTPRDLARILSVPVGTIWAWTSTGRLPVIRVSERTPRFDPVEISRWIEQRRVSRGSADTLSPQETPSR